MSKLRPAILIFVIGALAFMLGYVVFPHVEETPGDVHSGRGTSPALDPGIDAPDFMVTGLDGTEMSSAEFKGQIVVLDLWATWCAPCLTEIPHYNELHRDYQDMGVAMLGVTLQSGSAKQVEDWISRPIQVGAQQFELEYPVVMGNDELEVAWGPLYGFPLTYLVDSNWKIRKKWLGAVPNKTDQLRVLIDQLLEEQGQQAAN